MNSLFFMSLLILNFLTDEILLENMHIDCLFDFDFDFFYFYFLLFIDWFFNCINL